MKRDPVEVLVIVAWSFSALGMLAAAVAQLIGLYL